MLYFPTRKAARDFAAKQPHYKAVDCKDSPSLSGLRWGVRVLK